MPPTSNVLIDCSHWWEKRHAIYNCICDHSRLVYLRHGFPPPTTNMTTENTQKTIWRCISYQTWWFSIVNVSLLEGKCSALDSRLGIFQEPSGLDAARSFQHPPWPRPCDRWKPRKKWNIWEVHTFLTQSTLNSSMFQYNRVTSYDIYI